MPPCTVLCAKCLFKDFVYFCRFFRWLLGSYKFKNLQISKLFFTKDIPSITFFCEVILKNINIQHWI